MIPGATTFVNKWTGETKQKCACGSSHPIDHKICLNCGAGMSEDQKQKREEEEQKKYKWV